MRTDPAAKTLKQLDGDNFTLIRGDSTLISGNLPENAAAVKNENGPRSRSAAALASSIRCSGIT